MEGIKPQGTTEPTVNEPLVTLDTILDGAPAPAPAPVAPVAPANTPPVVPDNGTPPATPPAPTTQTTPPSGEPQADTFESTLPVLLKDANTLTPEEKELRTGIFDLFKAQKVDASGNLLNDKNEVVFTAAQLKSYIDNDELPLNDKGQLVNSRGEVVFTQQGDLPLVEVAKQALATQLGLDLSHVTVEDTEDGLVQLVLEGVKARDNETIGKFLDSAPALKQFYQHLALGNNPEEFVKDLVDYGKINITALDEMGRNNLLQQYFKKQGIVNPTNIIESLKKGGDDIVKAELENAVKFLDKTQKQESVDRDIALRNQLVQEQQQVEKYWGTVEAAINKGKLGSIDIPIKDRVEFFNYLSTPVDEHGNSAEMLDEAKEDVDFQLMVSFLRYKKYDISKLAGLVAKEQRALSLRERVAKQGNKSITENGVPRTAAAQDDNLSLERILG